MMSVYVAIAVTVPMTNMLQCAMHAALVGRARTGTTTNSASGCSPYTMPVA